MSYTMPWAQAVDDMRERYGDSNLTYEGETRTVSEWARHLGILKSSLYARLHRYNNRQIDLSSVFAPNRLRRGVLA